MIDGWRRERWKHTGPIMWIIASVNRDPKASTLPVDTFSPYRVDTGRPGTKIAGNIHALKAWLPKQ